jgi:hypothetical protein
MVVSFGVEVGVSAFSHALRKKTKEITPTVVKKELLITQ